MNRVHRELFTAFIECGGNPGNEARYDEFVDFAYWVARTLSAMDVRNGGVSRRGGN
jgi:hypothetical protein